jgi:hypothetical protein
MAYPHIAMADLFSRTGGTAAGTDATKGVNPSKLWLPIWSGEVIHAYDQYNKFEGMVDSKNITSGTTMEFPITGTVALNPAWGAGIELSGGTDSAATTFSVKLDKRPMAAHFELDNIDLMITQWEYRTELARQAGLTLANARDKQIASYIARASIEGVLDHDPRPSFTRKIPAANASYAHFGDGGGDDNETNAALTFLKDIENWMVYLQENDIPTEGVYAMLTAAQFQSVRALGVARDFSHLETGGTGAMFAGVAEQGGLGYSLTSTPQLEETLEYMGCTICKTNHGPKGKDYTNGAGAIGEARYNGDFQKAAAPFSWAMWQRGAVASLSLQGLKVDTVDDIRRNTTFTVASKMAGTGILRPECAWSGLAVASSAAVDTRAEVATLWELDEEYVDSTTYGG